MLRLFLLVFLCSTQPLNYATIFGEDYQKAQRFCSEQQAAFVAKAQTYGLSAETLQAIVFPELIRYNRFQNFFETKALEWAYIEGGAQVADFSIGHFQMKPSFVETLEQEVHKDTMLQKQFAQLFDYQQKTKKEKRKIRLERLQELDYQLDYLCCFLVVCQARHATTLQQQNQEEKIKFYATAYNSGWQQSAKAIKRWMQRPTFPYGADYPPPQQYVYADIAWSFVAKEEGG